MALQYNGVEVDNLQYNGVDVEELQYNGVTVWTRTQSTVIVAATNVFESKRGFGGGLTGGSIGPILGKAVVELTVANWGDSVLFFGYQVKPQGATSIRLSAPDVVFVPGVTFTWDGQKYAGQDNGQFFSALVPGTPVKLNIEVIS